MILKIQIIITTADTFYCCDRFTLRGFGFIDMKNALCFTAIGAFEVGKFITERFECHPAVRVANNNIPDEKHNVTRSQDIGGILIKIRKLWFFAPGLIIPKLGTCGNTGEVFQGSYFINHSSISFLESFCTAG